MDLCAERVGQQLNMYMSSGQTVIKRIITFRDESSCRSKWNALWSM